MRNLGGGDDMYDLPVLNTDSTVVVNPYGLGSPVELGHKIQATK